MVPDRSLKILVAVITSLSGIATIGGIVSDQGKGTYNYESIRGESVQIYGKGIYHHMTSDVVIQGIAQDYITLLAGIPLLILSAINSFRASFRWQIVLSGTLGYFFVSYLFYLVMAMYNPFFLIYVILAGTSFFAFSIMLRHLGKSMNAELYKPGLPYRPGGALLIFNSLAITLLWLSVIIPPLLDGTVYPVALAHYTTLVVQGLDLAILLPLAFLSGLWFYRKTGTGLLAGPVYLVFLSILMTALVAKLLFMGSNGYEIIPAVFFIPVICTGTIITTVLVLRKIE